MAERASELLGYPVVFTPESVASSPESVICFLVGQLVNRGSVSSEQADWAACQILNRERQGSTALASGVAVPDSETEVPCLIGIIGRLTVPIKWSSQDWVPLEEVCLLLLSANYPQAHIRPLEEAIGVLSVPLS